MVVEEGYTTTITTTTISSNRSMFFNYNTASANELQPSSNRAPTELQRAPASELPDGAEVVSDPSNNDEDERQQQQSIAAETKTVHVTDNIQDEKNEKRKSFRRLETSEGGRNYFQNEERGGGSRRAH